MKKFLSLVTVVCALLAAALIQQNNVSADVATKTFTTNETALIVATNCVIDSMQISGGTALFQLELYDNNAASTTYINTAYTNRIPVITNLTTVVITETGLTNTYTNKVLMTQPVVVAAATNTLTKLGAFAVAASESMVIPNNFLITKGIVLKNVSGGTNSYAVIVNYHVAGQ